ncbi:MAG TPA: AI-2E family transporter, partial [Longimicrobium sp.]|nr:AI-2E family transporter [Longimicrobium sp.]
MHADSADQPRDPPGDGPGGDSVLTPDVDATADAVPVEAGSPKPDLGKTGEAMDSTRGRSAGVTTLTVLALLYTLYFARPFLLPIVVALLLSFLFSPVVRALARFRIPPPVSAGLIILGLLGSVGFAGYELSGPVQRWAASAPETFATAQARIRTVLQPLERASRTAQQVERSAGAVAGPGQAQEVVVKQPSLIARVFGTTQRFLVTAMEVLILLYFLLAAGDLFLQKLIKVLPTVRDKRKAVEIARKTEASISTYLLTTFAITLTEGVVVTLAMWALGMPNPLLWGAMVVVLEFIPYLGALIMTGILTLAALTVYDTVGQALLVPGAFLLINVIQGNFVSPMLMGHKLALNPVA